jgi:hypothetical protein
LHRNPERGRGKDEVKARPTSRENPIAKKLYSYPSSVT